MNGRAYYNEIDPAAVAVLRELVDRGVLAPGDVDDRSIKEVRPSDLSGYTQCHFFAGGGLWSVAARLAGWPDERRLWTGSCPCQGESLAGKRLGADDPRHLWPDFYRLIRACRPPVVMGEQVAAAAGTHWLDGVCVDLADEDYAARAVDIPACAVDAPHQRNRLYWIAVDDRSRQGRALGSIAEIERGNIRVERTAFAEADVGADERGPYLQSNPDSGGRSGRPEIAQRLSEERAFAERITGRLQPNTDRQGQLQRQGVIRDERRWPLHGNDAPPNGSWWADAEWIVSPLDGKARRTKPGIPFLVDGLPGRVDLWRVGGNAISPILYSEVIAAFLESETEAMNEAAE